MRTPGYHLETRLSSDCSTPALLSAQAKSVATEGPASLRWVVHEEVLVFRQTEDMNAIGEPILREVQHFPA
ncbi:hypothetical protein EGJ22_02285 [Pseudomonas sp. p99-361]|nr:hypothetical protein A3K88_03995 [Pseudomonas putida]PPB16435.1 hypothetical protein HV87_17815 [Pseudomonas aeruginosa]RRV23529.1 hypothetical protein EGJ22_02285 [Pseudomonas sp. p99-361]